MIRTTISYNLLYMRISFVPQNSLVFSVCKSLREAKRCLSLLGLIAFDINGVSEDVENCDLESINSQSSMGTRSGEEAGW